MHKTLIVAHRGDSQFAPENSLPAFELAIRKGADVIEFDIHSSRDHHIVVHHDYYLGRTETGAGFIGDYSFSELQAFDVGLKFDGQFAGTRMPSLNEVLDLGKGKTRFEIEVCCPTLAFLQLVVEQIRDAGVTDEVEITSPHVPLLAHVKALGHTIRTGIFFGSFPSWMEKQLGQQHILDWLTLTGAQVAHLPLEVLDEALLELLHSRKFIAHAADLNDEEKIKAAIALGLDQFSTNALEMAFEIRDTMSAGVRREQAP